MKKINNWTNFILGLLANWYGYFLLLMIFIGMFTNDINGIAISYRRRLFNNQFDR